MWLEAPIAGGVFHPRLRVGRWREVKSLWGDVSRLWWAGSVIWTDEASTMSSPWRHIYFPGDNTLCHVRHVIMILVAFTIKCYVPITCLIFHRRSAKQVNVRTCWQKIFTPLSLPHEGPAATKFYAPRYNNLLLTGPKTMERSVRGIRLIAPSRSKKDSEQSPSFLKNEIYLVEGSTTHWNALLRC